MDNKTKTLYLLGLIKREQLRKLGLAYNHFPDYRPDVFSLYFEELLAMNQPCCWSWEQKDRTTGTFKVYMTYVNAYSPLAMVWVFQYILKQLTGNQYVKVNCEISDFMLHWSRWENYCNYYCLWPAMVAPRYIDLKIKVCWLCHNVFLHTVLRVWPVISAPKHGGVGRPPDVIALAPANNQQSQGQGGVSQGQEVVSISTSYHPFPTKCFKGKFIIKELAIKQSTF